MSRQKLKQARKDAGMTQEQVAGYLHITIGYYKMIESGERTGNVELWDVMEDLFNIHQRSLREISKSHPAPANNL